MNKALTQIVGTNHNDIRGPQRINEILDKTEPDILIGESNDL